MNFKESYEKLNEEQRRAVDTIEGPVMLIAGPGTGKTQTLTLRIANILLKTDVGPEAILAITFTEAGVVAMRKRLSEIISSAAFDVNIFTFHAFANNIIQRYADEFPNIIGSVPATEVDQLRLVEKCIEETTGLKLLRPFGDRFHYLRDIISAIKELKREGVGVEEMRNQIQLAQDEYDADPDKLHLKGAYKGKIKSQYLKQQKSIDKNQELALIYEQYQNKLRLEKLYDYEDMITEVVNAMKSSPDLLHQLQEQFQYVLVDEHQDTNNAQNRLLELLMSFHDEPNLFIVGDAKQAIFRFQGASLENFSYFQKKYKHVELIALTQNYRSSQSILDAAADLMKNRGSESLLQSQVKRDQKPVSVFALENPESELYFVGADILDKVKNGTRAEEIAVLYRNNGDVLPLVRMLDNLQVPYHIESDLDVLADHEVNKLIYIFHSLNRFAEAEYLWPVFYLQNFGLDPFDIHKLNSLAFEKRIDVATLMEHHRKDVESSLLNSEAVYKTYALLKKWKIDAENRGLLELFDIVLEESGLLSEIMRRPDSTDVLQKLGVFLKQIQDLVSNHPQARLSDLIEHVDRLREHRIMVHGALLVGQTGKVRLMTAHRSKGLEFDHVYIINANDKHWSNRRSIDKLPLLQSLYSLTGSNDTYDELEDERNLFFVAMTRARREVTISYSQKNLEGSEILPTQFIKEIKPELIHLGDAKKYEAQLKNNPALMFKRPTSNFAADLHQAAFIRELFKKRGFAVTHLNNYLRCPWQYFFVNLLVVPKSPSRDQLYGIAVHCSLRDLFIKWQKNGSFDENYLLKRFNYHAGLQPFAPADRLDITERGQNSLPGYFKANVDSWTLPVLVEFRISGIELAPDIWINGQLDKVELIGDGTVNVIDYKTSKPKSHNQIMGQTREADASFYRQLVFYKLLLDLYKAGQYKMRKGIIDFVEPNESGKFKREEFEIAQTEVKEIKDLILKTADEIINLKFWDKTCDEKDCQYCILAQQMKRPGQSTGSAAPARDLRR